MKNFKKWMSVALTATLVVLALAACGNGGSSANNEGEVFRIGGIGPTTGGAAIFGQAVQNGAQLAVDEINAAGGINGFQIEFNFQDDQHDSAISINAYNSLIDWGMQILLGPVTSTPAIAVGSEVEADNIFMLTPSATAVAAIDPPTAFRVCFSDPDQGTVAAQYIHNVNLAQRIGILYDNSDAYSSGIFEAFTNEADVLGLDIVSIEAFTSSTATDFSVQLQRAQEAEVDLLFIPFYFQEAALVLQQAANINFNPIFFSADGMDGILTVDGLDHSLVDGVMFLAPFAATAEDEATVAFVTAFEEKFGELPNQFAANAYDAIFVIKQAIEEANVTPDMDIAEIGDLLSATMREMTVNGITLYNASWDERGEPNKDPMVVEIRDGIYHIIYPVSQ